MARFIKPADRSALGLRENAILGPAAYALSQPHDASLDIGIMNALFIWDIILNTQRITTNYILDKVFNVPPWNGYGCVLSQGKIIFYWQDAGGGSTTYPPPVAMGQGRHIIGIFIDRSGNIYQYDNGTLILTVDNSAYNGIDKSAPGGLFRMLQGTAFPSQALLGFQMYFFTASQLPDATDRAQIVAEIQANPYEVPVTLQARPNYTTEQRLWLPFENLDPDSLVITDNSAYGNDVTIAGGNRVRDCVKEYYNV